MISSLRARLDSKSVNFPLREELDKKTGTLEKSLLLSDTSYIDRMEVYKYRFHSDVMIRIVINLTI